MSGDLMLVRTCSEVNDLVADECLSFFVVEEDGHVTYHLPKMSKPCQGCLEFMGSPESANSLRLIAACRTILGVMKEVVR